MSDCQAYVSLKMMTLDIITNLSSSLIVNTYNDLSVFKVKYLEHLVQSRLVDNSRPLHDLYNTLHSLCQSLQLEVLYSQTTKLIFDRLGDYIRIEEYKPGKP